MLGWSGHERQQRYALPGREAPLMLQSRVSKQAGQAGAVCSDSCVPATLLPRAAMQACPAQLPMVPTPPVQPSPSLPPFAAIPFPSQRPFCPSAGTAGEEQPDPWLCAGHHNSHPCLLPAATLATRLRAPAPPRAAARGGGAGGCAGRAAMRASVLCWLGCRGDAAAVLCKIDQQGIDGTFTQERSACPLPLPSPSLQAPTRWRRQRRSHQRMPSCGRLLIAWPSLWPRMVSCWGLHATLLLLCEVLLRCLCFSHGGDGAPLPQRAAVPWAPGAPTQMPRGVQQLPARCRPSMPPLSLCPPPSPLPCQASYSRTWRGSGSRRRVAGPSCREGRAPPTTAGRCGRAFPHFPRQSAPMDICMCNAGCKGLTTLFALPQPPSDCRCTP